MSTKLSYDKFASLLKKHNYLICVLYYIVSKDTGSAYKHVTFIECKLPQTQKNVLIAIPLKYIMKLPPNPTPRTIEIMYLGTSGNNSAKISDQSVAFLLNARGPLIESDLSIISADVLCYSKFSGEIMCYLFASGITKYGLDDEIEEIESESDDEIQEIEKEFVKATSSLKKKGVVLPEPTEIEEPEKVDIEQQITKDTEEHTEENVTSDNTDINITDETNIDGNIVEENTVEENIVEENTVEENTVEENTVEEKVELIFEDKPRKNKKIVKEISEDNDEEDEDEEEEEEEDESEEDESEEEKVSKKLKLSHRSNHVLIEDLDIRLGIVYVAIEASILYEKLGEFENEAISIYEQLDDNERDIRNDRLKEIKKQLDLAGKHIESRINNIENDEKKLKYQLLRLTAVLQDCDKIKNVTINNPQTSQEESIFISKRRMKKIQKHINDKGDEPQTVLNNSKLMEIDKVYNKTKKTIHELNVALLRHRETVEDIIINYEESIKELFEL